MTYSNSPLVSYVKLSPNNSGTRTKKIDRITPHCVVGQCSVETLGEIFYPISRQASCQYGIGPDGRIGMYVEEKDRSWCSSSRDNDQQSITIECASDKASPYAMKDVVYQRLIELCVDICVRNGKKKLLWIPDKDKALSYKPKSDEMLITVHRWFSDTFCPGDWLFSRLGDLASKVTSKLNGDSASDPVFPECPFLVDVLIDDLNYRSKGSMTGKVKGQTGKGTFTIVKTNKDGWGYLKSGVGWIYLLNPKYVKILDNSKTEFKPYLVQVGVRGLNIRTGPGTNYDVVCTCDPGIYTIVGESGPEKSKWGKLKSGIGWINLNYTTKLS